MLAAQVYEGQLSGKVVYTSGGHGWQWNSTLGRYATDRGDNNEVIEDFGNQDQLSYYADYLLRAGATVVPMRPVGHQTREVVLDNDSPGVTFTAPIGAGWTNSASTHRYDEDYGATPDAVAYRTFVATSGAESAVATYQPNIPVAGFYPVYTWALSGTNRTNQLYRVNHSGGSTELRVDHRMVGKGWVYLGTYHFAAGSSPAGNVQISNQSGVAGTVIADAIRFGNGMGDFVDGGGIISGYPREDENSFMWLSRSVGTGVTASSIIGTDNVSAPSDMAEWMHSSSTFGNAVYIGFHSNAGGGRGARGLIDADTPERTPNQPSLALYTGRQINQDMVALNGSFEHNWDTGTTHTFTGEFGEINLGTTAEMDATIIEVGFHDSALDAALMRDPKVRDQIARSTYEATLEYFDNFGGLSTPVSQPDEPTAVRAAANSAGDITITWAAPATRAGGPAAATGYRVYTSRNGYGFGDPVQVAGGGTTSLTIPAAQLDGEAYYFKVAATNAGGEGPGSAVVGARRNGAGGGGGTNRILIVNGFDRFERSQNERQAYPFSNPDGFTDRVRQRYNNTFDYVARFGEAVEAYTAGGAALGFDTVQNEQVADGTVLLTNYQTVLWISGDESTDHETFSSTEQSRLNTYLTAGNRRLFVSGAEIGWDLDRPTGPTAGDRAFYNQRLRADYVGDDANTYNTTGIAGSIFAGLSVTFDNGANSNDDTVYDVDFPDVLAASNGSMLAMNYSGGTGGGAAVQWADPAIITTGARGVNMGFPFESITTAANRNAVMAAVLGFFETAVSIAPTGVDLLAADDTGSSNTDDVTNRNNAGAGKTLRVVVSGTVAGATINVYSGASLIGTAPGAAGSTTVTTNALTVLADGVRSITAKQTETNKTISAASPALDITVDTAAPTADVVDVSPDPRTSSVASVQITFSRAVTGFDLADLSLTRDGGANLLTGGESLTTADNVTFTLNNLGDLTATPGAYVLSLNAGGSGIADTLAGNGLAAGASDAWTNELPPDNAAPTVTAVFVSGSAWDASFLNFLQSTGAGEAAFGYRLDAAGHADELPWTNVSSFSVRFSENVTVSADDLVARGLNAATYAPAAAGTFAYDPATFTATWTLAAGLPADKLLLDLDADAGTGVADAAGNRLDGEWANPASSPLASGGADAFPSGDGTAGGDFRFRVNVLPGDVNRSGGTVNAADVTQVRSRQSTSTTVPGTAPNVYSMFYDVNGDGLVDTSDVTAVRNRQATTLPAGEPTAPAARTTASLKKTLVSAPVTASTAAVKGLTADKKRLVDDVL